MKTLEEDIKETKILHYMVNSSLNAIFDRVQELVNIKQYDLAVPYLKALAIDLIGKILTYPNADKQKELDHICQWLMHKYNIELEIKVK